MKTSSIVFLVFGIIVVIFIITLIFSNPSENITPTQNVSLGINPVFGNPNSSVKIVEFSDFQCPACKRAVPIIENITETYNVSLCFRNFPLPSHPNAFIAAEAAECANEQNKFWEYHDILFENQNALDNQNLKQYAQQLNLNTSQFNSCLDTEKYRLQIENDIQDGQSLGIRGTPTFFVNGKQVLGANQQMIIQYIQEG